MTNANCIQVLSVDDHPLFREGVGCHDRALRPDVILMDLRLPDLGGLDVMIAMRSESPDAGVIVLTTFRGDRRADTAMYELASDEKHTR